MMAKAEFATKVEVTGIAVARPGDAVLIGFGSAMTDDEWMILRDRLEEQLPDGIRVALIENVTSMVVVKVGGGE